MKKRKRDSALKLKAGTKAEQKKAGTPEVEVLPGGPDTETVVEPPKRRAPSARPSTKGVVPYDALSAYMREVRQFPPLSREQEQKLALRYLRDQDLDAAYRLVSGNLWLVVKIARDYEYAARNLLDLIQEGNIGLMEAVKNFDPYRGVRFPSYAVWWIKAYVIRYIMANIRMVKIGTTQAQRKLFFNLQKEKEKLEREGFYPGPRLLAEKLNVKEREVIEMEQRLGSPDVSVDAPLQAESASDLHAVLPDSGQSVEDAYAERESRALLKSSFEDFSTTLNEKERIIFRERMLSEDKATLNVLGEKLSISRERVRQIENRIREKLKVFLSEKFGDQVEQFEFD